IRRARSEWQLPQVTDGDHVGTVPVGEAVIRLPVEWVQKGHAVACSVERLTPRVRQRKAERLGEALSRIDLERVVIAVGAVVTVEHAGGPESEPCRVERKSSDSAPGRGRIQFPHVRQMPAKIADVPN